MKRNDDECPLCGNHVEDGCCDQCGYRDDGEGWMNWVPKQ